MNLDMSKLRILDGSDEILEDARMVPGVLQHHEEVARILNCGLEDLCLLAPLDEDDEEGWDCASFFPRDVERMETVTIAENLEVEGMAIGYVARMEVNGVTFVAECNASPFFIYANKNLLRR